MQYYLKRFSSCDLVQMCFGIVQNAVKHFCILFYLHFLVLHVPSLPLMGTRKKLHNVLFKIDRKIRTSFCYKNNEL